MGVGGDVITRLGQDRLDGGRTQVSVTSTWSLINIWPPTSSPGQPSCSMRSTWGHSIHQAHIDGPTTRTGGPGSSPGSPSR